MKMGKKRGGICWLGRSHFNGNSSTANPPVQFPVPIRSTDEKGRQTAVILIRSLLRIRNALRAALVPFLILIRTNVVFRNKWENYSPKTSCLFWLMFSSSKNWPFGAAALWPKETWWASRTKTVMKIIVNQDTADTRLLQLTKFTILLPRRNEIKQ